VARCRSNSGVLGIILTGSRARPGTITDRSDYDILLIAEDAAEASVQSETRRDAALDITVLSLSAFRQHAAPGSDTAWNRYAFCHCQLLKDTNDHLIARLAATKATMTQAETATLAPAVLDGFLNAVYRCIKNDRDGNELAAHLEAAQALPSYLAYVFALHGRIRPYPKYLPWELQHYPLSQPSGRPTISFPCWTRHFQPKQPVRSTTPRRAGIPRPPSRTRRRPQQLGQRPQPDARPRRANQDV
jgi:hypothetical protein